MRTKNIIISIWLLNFILFIPNVNAEEVYYKNNQGVSFTKEEYNFISDMYWEGYQDYITIDEYTEIKNNNLFDKEIKKESVTNYPITRGTSVTANLRTLTIAKSCSSKCLISLTASWNGTPTIKSYDVIGARVSGVSVSSIVSAIVTGNNYSKSYSSKKSFSNGFGYSIVVPNVSNIKSTVTFYTTKGGTIYGSYQHAMKNTTQAVSNQYSSLSSNGFGGVFDFTGTAKSVYDNAPGVNISV